MTSEDPVEQPPSRWSTRKLRIAYDSLRRRYYFGGLGKTPPSSTELRFSWLPENSPDLGVTHFDDDDDPESVEVNLLCRIAPKLMRTVLLHELSHMYLGREVKCPTERWPMSPEWRAETIRLAGLGAPLL